MTNELISAASGHPAIAMPDPQRQAAAPRCAPLCSFPEFFRSFFAGATISCTGKVFPATRVLPLRFFFFH
jgi:hypothetical protein